jgi:hypothetical protein
MHMTRLVILALLATAWIAGVAAIQRGAGPAGLLVGRVVDAGTNAPLAGVVVNLIGGPAGARQPDWRVISDSEGRFMFRNLPAGRYEIQTSIAGRNAFSPNGFVVTGMAFPEGPYLDGGFGQRRPKGPLRAIDLADGQRIGDLVVRLWKPAGIEGRLVDEAGEPLAGQVVGVVEVGGDGRLLTGPTMQTDDRGAYRFGTLTPGTYVVFAPQTQVSMPISVGVAIADGPPDPVARQRFTTAGAPSPLLGGLRVGGSVLSTVSDSGLFGSGTVFTNALAPVRDGDALLAYQTTFHPAATSLAEAVRLTLSAGEERSGIDVALRPARAVAVSGVVIDDRGPVPHIGIHLLPGDIDDEGSILETALTATDAQGRFVFPTVPAGRYTAVVWRTMSAPTGDPKQPAAPATRLAEQAGAWAMLPISVGGQPVDRLSVTMRPPIEVSGRVEFSGSSPKPPAERLPALTIARARSMFRTPGPSPGSRIDPAAGVFHVRGVSPPGRFVVGLPGLPAPWSLQSVTIAGRDVTDAAFDVSDAALTDLAITFTDRPASLGGSVSGAADVSILVFPADRTRWRDARVSSRTFRQTKPGTSGAFIVQNLPPGSYLAAAIDDEQSAAWPDMALLTKLAAAATPITIAPGQQAAISLKASAIR